MGTTNTSSATDVNDHVEAVLGKALARFRGISSYEATIRSEHAGGIDLIVYRYMRPGFVRVDWVEPHRGAILIYDPEKQRVSVWPLGISGLPPLVVRPDNRMIAGPSGQRIDRSDIGTLLNDVAALLRGGHGEVIEDKENHPSPQCHVRVTGEQPAAPGPVRGYDLWLDLDRTLPVKAVSLDRTGARLESVTIDRLKIDPDFPQNLFKPK